MKNTDLKHVVFIMYDGISNPVFHNQTLLPLLTRLSSEPNLHVTLISFEKKGLSCKIMQDKVPSHDRLHFICAQRYRFFGIMSLLPAQMQLKRILKGIKKIDELIVRGPLAAYVALRCIQKHRFEVPKVTILARGLCAEEFRFVQEQTSQGFLKKAINSYIYSNLRAVEKYVYEKDRRRDLAGKLSIEAVSPALKDYLVESFNASRESICLAKNDIPQAVTAAQRAQWRDEVRAELAIPLDKYVYCYSGSAYSWQCVEETILFFKEQFQSNKNSMILILTQHTEEFKKSLEAHKIACELFRLISVSPEQIYRYLSAADAGILFRKKDIINWVSRPTKLLEYEAAHLKVIHNKTIGLLKENSK